MTKEQRINLISVPTRKVDVVLDTDAYNEIDDQFAIAYLLRSDDKLNTKAIYAAPFDNWNCSGSADGMERSYQEILKVLDLAGAKADVFRGADRFLSDENTPVISDAARDLVERARKYSPENPLYVVAIAAITNIASAILLDPAITENMVVVWLGGHAHHIGYTAEFNMRQDIAAARVVMQSGVPFVQLPCMGVVDSFTISGPELEHWLVGKNKLADYLAKNAIQEAEKYAAGKPWTRVIWDVTAVAWLLNTDSCFMNSVIKKTPLPTYDHVYDFSFNGEDMTYVYHIKRDILMEDLINKILK